MAEGPAPEKAPGAASPDVARLATVWPMLDRAMPWLMLAWALLLFFVAVPLDERFDFDDDDPRRLAALLAVVVVMWSALAGLAIVLAVRHAQAAGGLVRVAWCAVPAVLALALPIVVILLMEHPHTEDDATCSAGMLPRGSAEALFGWLPMQGYPMVAVVAALLGLALLAPGKTRRPGAWVLASAFMAFSLAVSGMFLLVNNCD